MLRKHPGTSAPRAPCMSEPSTVPATANVPAQLPTRPKSSWVVIAVYCAPWAVAEAALALEWYRGEVPLGAVVVFLWLLVPWQLGIILSVLPGGRFPADYPWLAPERP